jgi:putative ubiquitin-RnfH superfamily antitoxin RatB of RatAB toxin-antitoxin module
MDQLAGDSLAVEVACATPERQCVVGITVSPGVTARQAVRLSGIDSQFPALDIGQCALGIWGVVVADDRPLHDGDRVEVYRPLVNEPRQLRRRLAAEGQTMGVKER